MNKIYEVSLFDRDDGGHMLGKAEFLTAKEARAEFKRVKSIIDDGYEPYVDRFCRFETEDYDLCLNIIHIGDCITYFDKMRKYADYQQISPKEALKRVEYYFTKAIEDAYRDPRKKDVYNLVSDCMEVKNVTHTKKTSTYEISICDRSVFVFVDYAKKRHVTSGQSWNGYIMPVAEQGWIRPKNNPAVWHAWQR